MIVIWLEAADLLRFDLILAMDRGHPARLKRSCPLARRDRIKLFLDYLPGSEGEEIHDPCYGGEAGFVHALDLCEDASEALLRALSPRRV